MPSQNRATPVAAIALDHSGRVISADAETERLTGYSAQQLTGGALTDVLVAEADRPAVDACLARLSDGAVVSLELNLRRRDGSAVAAELTIADGGRIGVSDAVLVTLRDLSAQRLAKQVALVGQAVSGAIARADSPERATRTLLAALGQQMGWEGGMFWALDTSGALSATTAWPEEVPSDTAPGPLPARAHRSGDAEWSDPGDPWPGLAVPVRRGGLLVGVLELRDAERREPDPAVAEALTMAGTQIGELLGVLEDRFSLMSSLTRLALTDQLTGLPNRRAWEDALLRELARCRRSGEPVCIAVIDLDEFKAFNDEHGHQAGDRILTETARAWQQQLRISDILARYGGEEFAALIPAWPLDRAVEVVERVRRATPAGLTASAGVASWDGEESGSELFGRADAALYEAKQRGRNRTVAAGAAQDGDGAATGDGELV